MTKRQHSSTTLYNIILLSLILVINKTCNCTINGSKSTDITMNTSNDIRTTTSRNNTTTNSSGAISSKRSETTNSISDPKRHTTDSNDNNYNNSNYGIHYLRNPLLNQGTTTPHPSRSSLHLHGLIPSTHITLQNNVDRCMHNLRTIYTTSLQKYLYLQSIQDINEQLYYAILTLHISEVMPYVYTPTVGEACLKWSQIYRGTVRGLYLSIKDKGNIRNVLENWGNEDVTTIVVTDGERILGLGDLGVNGMGIPVGKLALYTACGGIHPKKVLPIQLDTGTNNPNNIQDPYYLGLKQPRQRGPIYDEFIQEFISACQDKFGRTVLIQFEDFGNINAFRLLHQYQDIATTFNDDIQGTAAVALAGLFASSRITNKKISEHVFLFAGAGEAGVGIADLIAYAISVESGIKIQDARKQIYLVDTKGLITKSRLEDGSLQPHKVNYAHDLKTIENANSAVDLWSSIQVVKPTVLIGVSATPRIFNQSICEYMAEINERPVIFALSNPTSKAECTAEEAYTYTKGKAVFSSGSPFDPVTLSDGTTYVPGQGNNAYVFPGIGLGALAAGSSKITDDDMYIVAKTLANLVSEDELRWGCVYPPLNKIREVSVHIAAAIATRAQETGVATKDLPKGDNDMLEYCRSLMYDPFGVGDE